MPSYEVLVGISYGKPQKHAEPGTIVDDLPERDARWMLRDQIIREVENGTDVQEKQQQPGQ